MNERRQGTKAMRDLADFFIKNPQEELSVADASIKLSIGAHYAAASLSALVGAGVVERVSVYKLKRADPAIGMRVAEALKADHV